MSVYDEHKAAVATSAGLAEELTLAADGIFSRLEGELMAAAHNAVGADPSNQAGQSALGSLQEAQTQMQEAAGAGRQVQDYLQEYGASF